MERLVFLKLDWPRLLCRLKRNSITFMPVSWSVVSIFTLSLLIWWVLLTFLLFFDDQGASWTIKIAFILPQSVVQWVGSLFCTEPLDIWKQHHLKCTDFQLQTSIYLWQVALKIWKLNLLKKKKQWNERSISTNHALCKALIKNISHENESK